MPGEYKERSEGDSGYHVNWVVMLEVDPRVSNAWDQEHQDQADGNAEIWRLDMLPGQIGEEAKQEGGEDRMAGGKAMAVTVRAGVID